MTLARQAEFSNFHVSRALAGLEILSARFRRHVYRPHSHAGHVIGVVTAGVERFRCGGVMHYAGPGDVIFINPQTLHDGEAGCDRGWHYHVIYPTDDHFDEAFEGPGGSGGIAPRFLHCVVHDPELADRLTGFHRHIRDQMSAFDQRLEWVDIACQITSRYAVDQKPARSSQGESRRIKMAREFLAEHYADDNRLVNVAEECGLSLSHFIRCFRRETGVTPHAYLNNLRVRRAKHLLDLGETPVQAAFAAGFADQSHLNRRFKTAFGMTPGQYRRAHIQLKN